MPPDDRRVVGIDFAALAAQWLGVTDDPLAVTMQLTASAALKGQPAARRAAIARSMVEFFREQEAAAKGEDDLEDPSHGR